MKATIPFGTLLLSVFAIVGVHAAEGDPADDQSAPKEPAAEEAAEEPDVKQDLEAAAKKLADAESFSWTQTMSFGGNREPRPISGKKGAGGFVLLTIPGRDGEFELLRRGDMTVVNRDGTWEILDAGERQGGPGGGPGRMLAWMAASFEDPTAVAGRIVSSVSEVRKSEDGKYQGKLDEEAAKELMRFRRGGRRGTGGAGGGFSPPPVTGAGGTAGFTVTNGMLTGYETHLTGRMNFNGEDRDITRITVVTFDDVGSTSFEIAEEAAGVLAEAAE